MLTPDRPDIKSKATSPAFTNNPKTFTETNEMQKRGENRQMYDDNSGLGASASRYVVNGHRGVSQP